MIEAAQTSIRDWNYISNGDWPPLEPHLWIIGLSVENIAVPVQYRQTTDGDDCWVCGKQVVKLKGWQYLPIGPNPFEK